MKEDKSVIILSAQASLKRRLRRHLKSLGFEKTTDGSLKPPGTDKDTVRKVHSEQRAGRLSISSKFIADRCSMLIKHFASGEEIDPTRIRPVLQKISSRDWESELFRLASLTWSVPVSNGFGRRIRYLVWDENNEKLMGIIAIGDPVFNLGVRDTLIGWNSEDRAQRLVNVMDAYVLGAMPPYNQLLGGKAVSCLIRTREVYDDFLEAYGSTTGIISQEAKSARLLAVTTSSSMGRSSIYNRLKLGKISYFRSIGYTGGWGHFHVPDNLFAELRNYLRLIGHAYADQHRFGQGPNWRLRTTRAALVALGINDDILRHGIQREVFLCEVADNAINLLRTGKGQPRLSSLLKAEEVGALAVERWMKPRAERRPDFRTWRRQDVTDLLGEQNKKVLAKLAKGV